MEPKIVTVASNKGGVGKSTIAMHLAGALDAPLVDLDWEVGGSSNMWGHDPRRSQRAALLDAFERGPDAKAPRLRRHHDRPPLAATHKDLGAAQLDEGLVTDCVLSWAHQWGSEWIVIDTHPGLNTLRTGAIAASDLVLVPVLLSQHEVDALEDFLADDLRGYSTLVVVNRVPSSAARTNLATRVLAQAGPHVAIGPVLREYRWLPRRRLRSALPLQYPEAAPDARPGTPAAAADQFRQLAEVVTSLLAGTSKEALVA
jgi:chromosome partitioning protein